MDREPQKNAHLFGIDRIIASMCRPLERKNSKAEPASANAPMLDDVEIHDNVRSREPWRPLIDITPPSPTKH
jgi:hypothetical protein